MVGCLKEYTDRVEKAVKECRTIRGHKDWDVKDETILEMSKKYNLKFEKLKLITNGRQL